MNACVERLPRDFHHHGEYEAILRAYYEDPSLLLRRELELCEEVYEARDPQGTLLAFFMVHWDAMTLQGVRQPVVYLGLSAVRRSHRGEVSMRDIYGRLTADAAAWEMREQRRLLLWFTTATPVVYCAAESLFRTVYPMRSGVVPPPEEPAFRALRSHYFPGAGNGHLAVLQRVAQGTRYTAEERARLDGLAARTGVTPVHTLGVREEVGDRLLCLCRTG